MTKEELLSLPPCGHALPRPDACPSGWCRHALSVNPALGRRWWGDAVVAGARALPPLWPSGACRHLGGETRRERCPSCRGRVEVKVLSCAIYGECTTHKKVGAMACCHGCPSYAPPGARITTRHLVYYVAPATGNGSWQSNVAQLRPRLPLFNGRRVVAVATGGRIPQTRDDGTRRLVPLDPPGDVRAAFGGEVDILEIPHSRSLRESAAQTPLLEKVQSLSPAEAVFRAHAKGVTHPVNPGVSIMRWAELLYEINLDYWPLVQRQLERFGCTGAFKKVGSYFATPSAFHYSGSFYWLRSKDLFARNWQGCEQNWYGVEPYPGQVFQSREAGSLFLEKGGVVDMYSVAYLRDVIGPAYDAWRLAHEADYRPAGKAKSSP